MSAPFPIDYTNKDFNSLRNALLDAARYRLPEWTDRAPGDYGMLLVDLFAYMGDIVLYYQDRIANQMYLPTATERRSIMNMLRLIGYELKPAIAATAELTLRFNVPTVPTIVTIPRNARFSTQTKGAPTIGFEYLGPDLTIDLLSSQVEREPGANGKLVYEGLPVRHSDQVVGELLGTASGELNLQLPLRQKPLILETLMVEVNEGSGWIEWQRRDNFLYHVEADGQVTVSNSESRDYYVQYDENGAASAGFGDGLYSRRPLGQIRASYSVGGGSAANVPANSITKAETSIPQLSSVTNVLPAVGGADAEDAAHAVKYGPLAFRSGQRAVTLNDFVALAYQAGGVAKVRALNRGWNRVDLYIAPEGSEVAPAAEDLKRRLLAYFEYRRMVGSFITIQDPTIVPIDISVEVIPEHRFKVEFVQQAVEQTIRDLLAFDTVDFGYTLYLSKVYEALEAINGVYAVTVTRFVRRDTDIQKFEQQLDQLVTLGISEIPDQVRRALKFNIGTEGRIDIGEFEIPKLGALVVQVKDASP